MSPLILWIPILAPTGSQNPPLDPSDPQTVIMDTSNATPGPLLTLSPRSRPLCQRTCSGHCTSQWSPAQTKPWSWGSVTQRPRSQCRQRGGCPRSTSGSSSGGAQVRWGAGRKKSGQRRDQGMGRGKPPFPRSPSAHIWGHSTASAAVERTQGGVLAHPGWGPRLHCAREKGKMFWGGAVVRKGESSWY